MKRNIHKDNTIHTTINMQPIVDTVDKAYSLGRIGCTLSRKEMMDTNLLDATLSTKEMQEMIATVGKSSLLSWLGTSDSKQYTCTFLKEFVVNKSTKLELPKIENGLTWAFIRGCFDSSGTINDYVTNTIPECSMVFGMEVVLGSGIDAFCNIPRDIGLNNDSQKEFTLKFSGTNCMDFLDKMYKNSTNQDRLEHNYVKFVNWSMKGTHNNSELPHCYVYKSDENAVLPSKEKASDVGYDLTIIKESKKWHNNITLYDTGIKIKMQHGYYAEVVPRSSLSKSGYMLANSVGIIDPSYSGNILVALIKVDDSAPDIVLPFRCCQLLFKHQINVDIVEVPCDFASTTRSDGGFGSTG